MRTINLYTVQMARWRKVKAAGLTILDTTVKSGHREVAPTWDMVMGHKAGTVSDEEYVRQYKLLLDRSLRENQDWWVNLLQSEILVLGCYCRADGFCHRYILKDVIKQQCQLQGIHVIDMGEFYG